MAREYHKIQTVFKRDPETKYKTLLLGEYSLPEFRYLAENTWVFTEKVDGTNIRIIWDGSNISFGGKTDRAQLPGELANKLSHQAGELFDKFKSKFGDTEVCLYGEGYGAKIQKGGVYRDDQDFVLFDVRVDSWWLQRGDVEDVANAFNLDIVPVIGFGTLDDMVDIVRSGFYSKWGDFIAEGIVARPNTELFTRNSDRIITKLKHKDFRKEGKVRNG